MTPTSPTKTETNFDPQPGSGQSGDAQAGDRQREGDFLPPHMAKALLQISVAINEELDVSEILTKVVRWTRELIDCAHASVILWDPENQTFSQGASTNEKDVAARVRKSGGTSRWIVEHNRPMIVENIHHDPHSPNPMLTEGEIISFVGVPILNKGQSIAVLYGLCRVSRKFDQREVDVLQVLANLAAVAITNAKLIRQATELHEQRKALMRLVAHDLLNPITNIQGFLDLFITDIGNLSEQHAQWMEIIQRSVSHMTDLISEVVRYERLTEKKALATDAVDLIEISNKAIQAFTVAAQAKEIAIAPPDPLLSATVEGDPVLLQEVVHNLVSNAIKYTPHRGEVSVTLQDQGTSVRLIVEDTGIGIAVAEQEQIFSPFKRTSEGKTFSSGYGLGLYLVKTIVTQHQGDISIESTPGVGTKVLVHLPKHLRHTAEYS